MAMTPQGVDYLGSGPSPAQLVAAGKSFRLGYIDRTDSSLTRRNIADHLAAGIAVGLIAEWGAKRMLGGANAGSVDGQRARDALRSLRAPDGTAVYFAADFSATSVMMPAIDAYLTAAGSVIGHVGTGCYGGRAVIRHVMQSRSAKYLWQTYAWSGIPPRWIDGVHLRQYLNHQLIAGKKVDLDDAPQAEWGQWSPSPPDTSTGDAMSLPIVESFDDPFSDDPTKRPRIITVKSGFTPLYEDGTSTGTSYSGADFTRLATCKVTLPNRTQACYPARLPGGQPGTELLFVRESEVSSAVPVPKAGADQAQLDAEYNKAVTAALAINQDAGARISGLRR